VANFEGEGRGNNGRIRRAGKGKGSKREGRLAPTNWLTFQCLKCIVKCFYMLVFRLIRSFSVAIVYIAVPAVFVDLILSSRPSRVTDTNQQKLITMRSYTENYRQSYSIRTVKDWNSLPQSIVSAGSLALFKSRLTSHVAP